MTRQRTSIDTEEERRHMSFIADDTLDIDYDQEHTGRSSPNIKQTPFFDLVTPVRRTTPNSPHDLDTRPQLGNPSASFSLLRMSEQPEPMGHQPNAGHAPVDPSQTDSRRVRRKRKRRDDNFSEGEPREYIMIEATPEKKNSGDSYASGNGESDGNISKSQENHSKSQSAPIKKAAKLSKKSSRRDASNPTAPRTATNGTLGRRLGTVYSGRRSKDASFIFEDEPVDETAGGVAKDTSPQLPDAHQPTKSTDEEMARLLQEEEYALLQPRSAFYDDILTTELSSQSQELPETSSELSQTHARSRGSARSRGRAGGRAPRGSTARGRRDASTSSGNRDNGARNAVNRRSEPHFNELAFLAQEYAMQDQDWQNMLGYGPLGRHPGNWVNEDDVDMSYEGLLRLGEQVGDVKQNCVNDVVIRNLPTMHFTARKVSEEELIVSNDDHESCKCTICLTDYEDGDTLKSLPCFHSFHIACIDHWMSMNESCPICRIRIEISE